jgi:hypothetical protein
MMQDQPADQLDVIMALAKDPLGGFPGYGKRLMEHAVEGLAIRKSLTEKACLALQLCIAHGLEARLKGINRRNMFTEGLQFPPFEEPKIWVARFKNINSPEYPYDSVVPDIGCPEIRVNL